MDCIYWGLFVSKSFPIDSSLEKDIENKHVTYAFRKPCPQSLVGQMYNVMATGYGNDGVNEGYRVELPVTAFYEGADIPHITLSISANGHAKDTGSLVFDDIEPFTIPCIFGYFGLDNIVHTS